MAISLQPRLMLDTTNVIFEVAGDITPKVDDKGAQKLDRATKLPMWTVPLYGRGRVEGEKWSAVFNVTVLGHDKPAADDGDRVVPVSLEALPWVSEQNGRTRSGTAFKATGLDVIAQTAVAAAA